MVIGVDQERVVLLLQVIGFVLGIAGQVLVNRKSVKGFYCWAASNFALIMLGILLRTYVLACLYVVYSCLVFHGIRSWQQETESS
jgi:nicotinamide riboside transporter PnuC